LKSRRTKSFQKLFSKLPTNIQDLAKKSYKLWIYDQSHPSLHFKKIQDNPEIYSVRIGIHWRAIGVVKEEFIYWHWIGSHEDYNNLV
jgi:hypothetical protein